MNTASSPARGAKFKATGQWSCERGATGFHGLLHRTSLGFSKFSDGQFRSQAVLALPRRGSSRSFRSSSSVHFRGHISEQWPKQLLTADAGRECVRPSGSLLASVVAFADGARANQAAVAIPPPPPPQRISRQLVTERPVQSPSSAETSRHPAQKHSSRNLGGRSRTTSGFPSSSGTKGLASFVFQLTPRIRPGVPASRLSRALEERSRRRAAYLLRPTFMSARSSVIGGGWAPGPVRLRPWEVTRRNRVPPPSAVREVERPQCDFLHLNRRCRHAERLSLRSLPAAVNSASSWAQSGSPVGQVKLVTGNRLLLPAPGGLVAASRRRAALNPKPPSDEGSVRVKP